MKKFTAKDVFEQIDFSDRPHGHNKQWTFCSGGFDSYVGPNRCFTVHDGEKFLTQIAESLSMDGMEVKGAFTIDERKALTSIAMRYYENIIYGVR